MAIIKILVNSVKREHSDPKVVTTGGRVKNGTIRLLVIAIIIIAAIHVPDTMVSLLHKIFSM